MPQFTIPCLIVKQRNNQLAPEFALFSERAGDVLRWAGIKRRTEIEEGTQRALNTAKLNALTKFLEKDERNTVAPAITMTLRVDKTHHVQTIDAARHMYVITLDVPDNTPDIDKPGMIIDGQHRLFGISAHNPADLVNVVALLNVNDLEAAFQFLVINNKVTPVQPDHIRTLALDYQEEELTQRLKTARLTLSPNLAFVGIMDTDDGSPFQGTIRLVSADGQQGQRFVPPAAIENAITVIQKKEVRELKSADALCEFFYAIWALLREGDWAELWTPESKLMTKAGIVAMTTFVADALIAKYDFAGDLDVSDPEKVREQVRLILQNQTPEFWRKDWSMKISDAVAVRERIVEALTKIYRNMRAGQAWDDEVDLVTP
jgi:DGQHR domain-containing protein